MWIIKVDDWPGLPYETWDQAHEAVWHDWLEDPQKRREQEFPLLQEDKAFSLVLGNTLYLVQEVEMAER